MAVAMSTLDSPPWLSPVQRAARWIFSVPLLAKVLGVGLMGAGLAGGLTFLHARAALLPAVRERLEDRLRSTGRLLQQMLWQDVLSGSIVDLERDIRYIRQSVPDLRYVIVEDATGRVVAHSFDREVPTDLASRVPPPIGEGDIQVLESDQGTILDAQFALQQGSVGRVRLGLSDVSVQLAMASLTNALFIELVVAMALSGGLAFVLSRLIADPLARLVEMAHTIGAGDFSVRATVDSTDEVGILAAAFNAMASRLGSFRASVEQKDAERALLISRTVAFQEEERQRVSRELHDRIGQSLLALLMGIRSAEARDGVAAVACGELAGKVESLATEVRQMAWDLRPPNLGERGLASALAQYVKDVMRPGQVDVDEVYMVPHELPRLRADIEVTLFRIAQEALTNVMRHSQVRRASLVLSRMQGSVMLLVEDRGVGFDPDASRAGGRTGVGLIDIRERGALISGDVTIESRPGHGTLVRVEVPLPEEEICPSVS